MRDRLNRRHVAAFRLWVEYEPSAHAHALPWRHPARDGDAQGLAFCCHHGRGRFDCPRAGAVVHGVLWRLGPRDLAAINAYESVDSGLYVRRVLPVRCSRRLAPALIYIARWRGEGRPRPGYISVVVEAAREWDLPDVYIRSLQRWSPSGWCGARTKDVGEFG